MPGERVEIIMGVDTHTDTHAAVAIDLQGRRLDVIEIPATPAGYRRLLAWARHLGEVTAVGVEGTESYGVGLSRFLTGAGITVIEVGRVNRQHRRHYGKSDPVDAEAAARAVLSGQSTGAPKSRDGIVESIRTLHVVKRSAIKARTQTGNQMTNLIITAPEATRAELRGLTAVKRAKRAAKWRPGIGHDPVTVTRRDPHPGPPLAGTDRGDPHPHQRPRRARPPRRTHPACSTNSASEPTSPRSPSSPRATTLSASAPRPASPPSAASTPSRHHPEGSPVTGSTGPATARPPTPSGPSPESGSPATPPPSPTPNGEPRRVSHTARSCAASSATSPADSSRSSSRTLQI